MVARMILFNILIARDLFLEGRDRVETGRYRNMQLLLLAAWSLCGVIVAGVFTPEPGRRFAWVPMATILGPMWAVIASERATDSP